LFAEGRANQRKAISIQQFKQDTKTIYRYKIKFIASNIYSSSAFYLQGNKGCKQVHKFTRKHAYTSTLNLQVSFIK